MKLSNIEIKWIEVIYSFEIIISFSNDSHFSIKLKKSTGVFTIATAFYKLSREIYRRGKEEEI